ncbi:MAG: hypothetical protein AB8B55_14040 [Mariniblastus sp.]
MNLIVGIDGTGAAFTPSASRNRQYDLDFANSFVKRIAGRAGANHKYFRGPVAAGGGLVAAVSGGYSFIKRNVTNSRTPKKVLLTGYSRGAAGAVAIAAKLKKANIAVDALLLFDCVDRHIVIDAEIIPNNVVECLHLIRDPKSSSRGSFSNDAMKYRVPTVVNCYKFLCTHGGMGGMPWTKPNDKKGTDLIDEGGIDGMTTITYAEDVRVSGVIWQYIQPFCSKHGFL